jgi:hypothetical protein
MQEEAMKKKTGDWFFHNRCKNADESESSWGKDRQTEETEEKPERTETKEWRQRGDVNLLQHPSTRAGDSFFHQDFESTHESESSGGKEDDLRLILPQRLGENPWIRIQWRQRRRQVIDSSTKISRVPMNLNPAEVKKNTQDWFYHKDLQNTHKSKSSGRIEEDRRSILPQRFGEHPWIWLWRRQRHSDRDETHRHRHTHTHTEDSSRARDGDRKEEFRVCCCWPRVAV